MNPPIYHNESIPISMKQYRSTNSHSSLLFSQLKESIRDMLRLQCDYQLSDELFWEAFDNRVLLNRPLNVSQYAAMLAQR
jgi:hypothetical protein